MKRLAAGLLQLRPGEGGLALFGSAFFLVVQASQIFAVNAGDALLFDRYGVEVLPYLYILRGAGTLIVATAYSAALGRPDRNRISLWVLGGLALVSVLAWGATFFAGPALYPALWLGIALVTGIVGTLIWVLAGEVCDARQSKRLFAVFASAGILGSMLAGFLTGPTAAVLGTETLLLVSATLLIASAAVARPMLARFAQPARRGLAPSSPVKDLRRAHHIVFSNTTMRLTAIGAVLFSVLFFTVSFPFSVEAAAAFPDEAELAGFLGVFGGIVTGVTFAVSLLLASRVLARIGLINSVLLLPLAYLAGFLLWAIRLDLSTAVLVRFVQLVLLGGLAGTAFNALFNVIPADQRSQVRAYQAGPPAQLGVMLSGVLILFSQRGLTSSQALAMGALVAVLCSLVVWRMRRSYGESLVEALRQGMTEVFTESDAAFDRVRHDAQARRVAERGLHEPRASVRRISLQILGRLQAVDSAALITSRWRDESPEVRMAAIEALGQMPLRSPPEGALRFLEDLDPKVRALATRTFDEQDWLPSERIESLLADSAPSVRGQAAIASARHGRTAQGMAAIKALLADPSPDARLAGMEACGQVEGACAEGDLIETLRSSSRELRRAAAGALGTHPTAAAIEALTAALNDPDGKVRRAAGSALASIDEAVPALTSILQAGTPRAQDEVVLALAGRRGAARAGLLDWAAGQLPEVERLRRWRIALADSPMGGAQEWLADLLGRSEWQAEQRILRGLEGAGSGQAMRAVARGLSAEDADLHAQAVEALDTIGDRRVTRGLIRLLEAGEAGGRLPSRGEALTELASHPRPWFRALALRLRAQAVRHDWVQIAHLAAEDNSPVVKEAVRWDGGPGAGGEMIETSATLGLVDRMLFLREVPLFRLLEPEDLERVAAVAVERIYHKGEPICIEGDPGEELFVLVEGSVEVRKRVDGEARLLRALTAGEHFGELAILREQPRSASVQAADEVRVLVLDSRSLRAMLAERPEVCLAMLESLAERMSTLG